MRDYLEAVRRCLLRRDAREARRLLDHAYGRALPPRIRAPLAELASVRLGGTPFRALRDLRDLQRLMIDEGEPAAGRNPAQLELALDPSPWSRAVSLTVARAARYAPGVRRDESEFPALDASLAPAARASVRVGLAR